MACMRAVSALFRANQIKSDRIGSEISFGRTVLLYISHSVDFKLWLEVAVIANGVVRNLYAICNISLLIHSSKCTYCALQTWAVYAQGNL